MAAKSIDVFEQKLLSVVKHESRQAAKQGWMIAISGGADSVALLSALHRIAPGIGLEIAAIHVNHGLRGKESEGDQRFVVDLCARLGVPLTLKAITPPDSEPGNLEAYLREQRYALFEEVRRLREAVLVTAHHADDQAETLLLKLVRGAGLAGLSGIHPRLCDASGKVTTLRPFLEFRRRDIIEYLERRQIPYREDSTNYSNELDRNWIRLELLPTILARLNPHAIEHLGQAAVIARESDAFLSRLAASELPTLVHKRRARGLCLDISGLRSRPAALQRYLLRQAIMELTPEGGMSPEFRHVQALLSLADGPNGKKISLPGNVEASRQDNQLLITIGTAVPHFSHSLAVPGQLKLNSVGKVLALEPWTGTPSNLPILCGLGKKITVRNRQEGDVFCTRAGHRRKLKKILNDERVPAVLRDHLIVLESGRKIVWVEGLWVHPRHSSGQAPSYTLRLEDETLGS